MTIKNLTYIHQLLIENEATRKAALNIVRDARNQAEDNEAANLLDLQRAYEKAWRAYNDALNARTDFEDKEWN